MKTTKELKPFQKVLVRQSPSAIWEASFFGRKSRATAPYYCLGVFYRYCIPYEGNEHLLGTKDSPEPKFKWGDKVEVSNYEGDENWTKAIFIKTNTLNNYMAIIEGRIAPIESKYCRHANW